MCAFGFNCPHEVITEFGERNCTRCPYAIWSASNIGAVAAKRQQLGEEYDRASNLLEGYIEHENVHDRELAVYQEKLDKMARELAGWLVVEESLWAMILHWQREPSSVPKYMVKDIAMVLKQVQRFEVKTNSAEEFFTRVGEACFYEQSISEELRIKIDRAVRLLLVRNGRAMEAALMTSELDSCTKLAGFIRSDPSFEKIDLDEFVRLIHLPSDEWRRALLNSRTERSGLSDSFLFLDGQ